MIKLGLFFLVTITVTHALDTWYYGWVAKHAAVARVVENGVDEAIKRIGKRDISPEWVSGVAMSRVVAHGVDAVMEAASHRIGKRASDVAFQVDPDFHLLNNGSYDENRRGLLLASVPRVGMGFVCEGDDASKFTELLESICWEMGHAGMYWWEPAQYYFNETELAQFPIVVTSYYQTNNTDTGDLYTEYYYNQNATCNTTYTNEYSAVYMSCRPRVDPTPAPEPDDLLTTLLSIGPDGGATTDKNEGVVIAYSMDERDQEFGTISLANIPPWDRQAVADMVCRNNGHINATRYTTFAEHPYPFQSDYLDDYFNPMLHNMSCPANASYPSECSYERGYDPWATFNDSLVVFCQANQSLWEITYGGIFREVEGETHPQPSNEGLVVIELTNTMTGQQIYGTVCDDGFSNASADVACQAMGYGSAVSWENQRNYQYISQEMLNVTGLGVVMDQFECPADASELDDCTYDLLKHDCSHTEDVTLVCAERPPTKVITAWLLYRMVDGEIVPSNEGVAGVVVSDPQTGEMIDAGTICDDGFSNISANIACQAMGFDYAIWWGNHGDSDYQYIPRDIVEQGVIVMDQFECPANAREVNDCNYDLLKHDCGHSEDVTLSCGGGSPTDQPPTRGPTSYPLDDEIAVEFGGLEVQMDVNPKKGRAKIADVLEEIADILGY